MQHKKVIRVSPGDFFYRLTGNTNQPINSDILSVQVFGKDFDRDRT